MDKCHIARCASGRDCEKTSIMERNGNLKILVIHIVHCYLESYLIAQLQVVIPK